MPPNTAPARCARCGRRSPGGAAGLAAALREHFPEVTSLPDVAGDLVTLHCPVETVHALASLLREQGADTISVARLDYVFARDNPLYARLEAGLAG